MKNIIVTGGSRGIGKCIVENLAKEGHNVLLNYNKSEKEALKTQKELKEIGINIEIYKADVSKDKEVKEMTNYFIKKFKKIDVLINNAGIAKIQLFTDTTNEDWEKMINNNLTSAFYTTREIIPNMVSNKSGLIINISSIWGMVGASCESIYAISKAGLDAMTKSLAKELAPSNIRVNSIAPGAIDTEMNNLNDEDRKELLKEIPLNRIGTPLDIYKCVKWLIEDEFTTGQIISPNGGFVII